MLVTTFFYLFLSCNGFVEGHSGGPVDFNEQYLLDIYYFVPEKQFKLCAGSAIILYKTEFKKEGN